MLRTAEVKGRYPKSQYFFIAQKMPNYLDEAHRAEIVKLANSMTSKTEWPTWLLLIGFYFAWLWVVFSGDTLGEVTTILLLIPLITLWMSIQHELIHGHPTRWPLVNKILGHLPFAVWYPYTLYRDSHLAHHDDEMLTVPGVDPESRYVTKEFWVRAPGYIKLSLWANKTLIGRLVIGAPLAMLALVKAEINRSLKNNCSGLKMWVGHVISLGMVLAAVDCFSAISASQYVLCVSIPALSVGMVRSFYEHRPADRAEHRTVINESSAPLNWLFLNNNLHLVHHDLPGLPWYYLPRVYRSRRSHWVARNNGYVIPGYLRLFNRNLITPVDCPRHPTE